MTELKTLKDLFNEKTITGDGRTLQHHIDFHELLRQEAIKDIKKFHKDGEYTAVYGMPALLTSEVIPYIKWKE